MAIGNPKRSAVNPIREWITRVIAQANATGEGVGQYRGSSSVNSEAIAEASGFLVEFNSSLSEVIAEAYAPPVFSNKSFGIGSVIAEAIGSFLALPASFVAGIDIYDEGGFIKKTTSLNFVGVGVIAKDDSPLDVFIPPPAYSSHFNTMDGTTDGSVGAISTSSRYVSAPTSEGSPFYAGGWPGTLHPASNTVSWVYDSTEEISFIDSATTFNVTINDPSGEIANDDTAAITGNGSYIVGDVTIDITNWIADSDKFKADVQITCPLNLILAGASGRLNIVITHDNGSEGTFDFTQTDVFFDSEPDTAALSGVTSSLNTPVTKQISGIYYMILNTTFNFGVSDLDYLNADSFPETQLVVTPTDFGIAVQNLSGGDLSGWADDHDNIDSSWSDTIAISQVDYRVCGDSAQLLAELYDWGAGASDTASALAVLIDTYTDTAINGAISIIQPFNGEVERKDSDGTSFDNTATLASDELLMHCGQLKVQQIDFTSYLPHNGSTIVNPDYSASGGATQYYYQFLTTDGSTRSGGVFNLGSGISEGDLGVDIFIDISLDGTDWYDCTSNFLGGTLNDGDGCRVSGLTLPQLQITLADASTNDASGVVPSDSIMVRISMPSTSSIELQQLDFTWST